MTPLFIALAFICGLVIGIGGVLAAIVIHARHERRMLERALHPERDINF